MTPADETNQGGYSITLMEDFEVTEGAEYTAEIMQPSLAGVSYHYSIKDHLGTPRLIFSDQDNSNSVGTSEIEEIKNFYPFGLEFESTDQFKNYRKAYNDKEAISYTQYLNFEARDYFKSINVFGGPDPISDQFPHVSSMNYAENSPVANVDLHGLQATSAVTGLQNIRTGDNCQSSCSIQKVAPEPAQSSTRSGALASSSHSISEPLLGASASGEFMSGRLTPFTTESQSISIGIEGSALHAQSEFRIGSEALGIHVSGEGSIGTVEANFDASLKSEANGTIGPTLDANAGIFAAEGEISGGGFILGVKYTYTIGGSLGSAHAGIKLGATLNKETQTITIEGMEHLGFGVGEKMGFKLEIPTFGLSSEN